MRKLRFTFFLVAMMAASTGGSSSFAQQAATSTQKQVLISEFRKLTGADSVNGSINFSSDSVRELLSAVFEQDKEITDAQKQDLRKSVAEATARIDKTVRDFLADKAKITAWSEEVIYKIYDKAFTEEELRELIAFYRTPTGQKAAAFLPTLSSKVQKEFGEVIRLKLSNIAQPSIQIETELLKQKTLLHKRG
ncbi:MAG TPA: DUF2059 domain-containing protein [Pyrinomonadaceae bacterium]|nr:DUF2059 domain-containing protein [Pyrinomonadaceae bacterium]